MLSTASRRVRWALSLGLVLFFATLPCQGLNVGAVQLRLEEELYASEQSFEDKMRSIVESAVRTTPTDLIVFPEYTSVFIACIPYYWAIESAQTYGQALQMIIEAEPDMASPFDLFIHAAPRVDRLVRRVFGGLAREYGVYILAGTYFAAKQEPHGMVLRNRACVFDRLGRLVYAQDKVFLTDFEVEIVGLSPGRLSEAHPFAVGDTEVSLTVCRDTYEKVWEQKFAAVDLWIDIKANGQFYTAQTQESFQRALPARIEAASASYGLTVCLTGKFLDLFWEGKSSLVAKQGRGSALLREAHSAQQEAILHHRISDI